jgi:phosphoenolpyruvate-protein phosphotransferase
VEAEQHRLQTALAQADTELSHLRSVVAQTVGSEEAAIFEAHQVMLKDPDLLGETLALITREHFSAAAALGQATDHQAQQLEGLENKALAARASDLRDAVGRVIRLLLNQLADPANKLEASQPVVLVAYDLTPSDTVNLNAQAILGICTVVGGPTTHAAILARALEIPAIAGLDPQLLNLLRDGQEIGLDGSLGQLYLQPDTRQQQALRAAMNQYQQKGQSIRDRQQQWRTRPATTADGTRVQVYANVGDLVSVENAARSGAEGIGLLRTEFLFNNRLVFPNEQEQFESYVTLFETFAGAASLGKTIVARTLDAGADKPFPALEPLIGNQSEANPALGVRGVRIHLLHEELLRQQLRALLRAAAVAGIDLQIMFPMITTLEEVRHLKTVYRQVSQELQARGQTMPPDTKVGIMIETPAAALMADVLSREVDFLSIGANDLYQYVMAADRTNSRVMAMFGRLEPAVWRLINSVAQAGLANHKPVAVCGEVAADPKIGPLLAGLGIHELSMSPPAIGRVKAALHEQPLAYWQDQAAKMLQAATTAEIQELLNGLA